MKPKRIKKLLFSEIKAVADNIATYCFHPEKDFTRNRKLSAETVLKGIIGMESGSLTNELIDLFHSSPDMPTTSAFVQQRNKISPFSELCVWVKCLYNSVFLMYKSTSKQFQKRFGL